MTSVSEELSDVLNSYIVGEISTDVGHMIGMGADMYQGLLQMVDNY